MTSITRLRTADSLGGVPGADPLNRLATHKGQN